MRLSIFTAKMVRDAVDGLSLLRGLALLEDLRAFAQEPLMARLMYSEVRMARCLSTMNDFS